MAQNQDGWLKNWLPQTDPVYKVVALELAVLYLILVSLEGISNRALLTGVLGVFSSVLLLQLLRGKNISVALPLTIPLALFSIATVISALFTKVPADALPASVLYLSLFAIFTAGFTLVRAHKDFVLWFAKVFFLLGFLITVVHFGLQLPRILEGAKFIGPFYWHNQMGGVPDIPNTYLDCFPLVRSS